ncbi:hypothetical protein [Streptomyces sp. NPDC093707]|uniref:hypothetical protein n=1 Tax=Streptomyces sp. NPDC093707 TaxID=3154984 RepID=UPI00344F9E81
MLHAKRIHPPSQEYELTESGRALTTFSVPGGRGSRSGARFTLRGVAYLVRTHRLSGVYELLDGDGTAVASTDRCAAVGTGRAPGGSPRSGGPRRQAGSTP